MFRQCSGNEDKENHEDFVDKNLCSAGRVRGNGAGGTGQGAGAGLGFGQG